MRKITLAVLVLVCMSASAQKKFAVFFGVNNSFFAENRIFGAMDIDANFGAQTGVAYNLDLNKTISFRPKLMYSQQGNRKQTAVLFANTVSPAYKIDYLNAAMDFKFWNKIYLLVGPQVGVVLTEQTPYAGIEPAKSVDFGVNLGGGFRVNSWFFELGGYTSLGPVLELPNGPKTKLYNAHSKFTVGYYIF